MDPFKEAMGRMESPEPKEESRGGEPTGGKGGEVHSIHHFAAGGKHHVVKHSSAGAEHSEHAAGEEKETCPLCGGSGEVSED